jgi:hypothetical protein
LISSQHSKMLKMVPMLGNSIMVKMDQDVMRMEVLVSHGTLHQISHLVDQ